MVAEPSAIVPAFAAIGLCQTAALVCQQDRARRHQWLGCVPMVRGGRATVAKEVASVAVAFNITSLTVIILQLNKL